MMSAALKYLRKPLTVVLTSGAIVLLGLLSFAGMYVLLPVLSVSIAAFVLSVIYEGEIYQKNISNALDKILNEHLTAQILGEEVLDKLDLKQQKLPSFLKTYKNLADKHPSPARDKRLKTMQIWFGKLLMNPDEDDSPYAKEILDFLRKEINEEQIKARAEEITNHNRYIKLFAMLAAGFMSLGTIFLILEVLPVLPFLSISPALLPFVVIPMASIAGIAYGFLSYNSLTDFLLKNNLQSWWQGIKDDLTSPDRSWKKIAFAAFSAFVLVLNLTLTLCTAGTWWTVVNATQTTWSWLKHPVTQFATSLIAPIVSVSTLGFNLQNTIETINEVKESVNAPGQEEAHEQLHETQATETIAQRFNPFRIILKITFTPLLLLLFLGHPISIGLTADRMPGVPAIVSALSGIISEGLEDFHYFFNLDKLLKIFAVFFKIVASPFAAIGYLFRTLWQPQSTSFNEVLSQLSEIFSEGFKEAFAPENHEECQHEHHHEHSAIPNQVLELLFTPLFALSALWHWYFQSSDSTQQKSYIDCFYQQIGWNQQSDDNDFDNVQKATDESWKKIESQFELKEQINSLKQQTIAPEVIQQKIVVLEDIFNHLNEQQPSLEKIRDYSSQEILNQHRFFQSTEKTASRACVDQVIRNLTPLTH